MSEQRTDVYSRITNSIIAAIEAGADEWKMPWHHDGAVAARPTNVATGHQYRSVNTLALWAAAVRAGYAQGLWGTYRQFQVLGAPVRKGEKATTVLLWKESSAKGDDESQADEAREHRRMFARAFSVFNVAQVDGYEIKPAVQALPEDKRHAQAEAFLSNLGIKSIFGGPKACYQPTTDTVLMPCLSQFRDAASFYGVWTHEIGHASGAKHRLDRDLTGRFGSAAYALEEITVEILSGLILADLAIAHHPRPDHAAYIASWLRVIKNDPSAIFTAASKAQQAADWMHSRQPNSASYWGRGEDP
jgi:antirestriction protein ArdC